MLPEALVNKTEKSLTGSWGRQYNSPPKMSTSESPEPVNVTLHDQKDFSGVIKLRLLRWGR